MSFTATWVAEGEEDTLVVELPGKCAVTFTVFVVDGTQGHDAFPSAPTVPVHSTVAPFRNSTGTPWAPPITVAERIVPVDVLAGFGSAVTAEVVVSRLTTEAVPVVPG
ncbi:hypothetical protein AB6N35_09860 [Dietzia cinnamea]|uniref:Uncharacterized protein n=1 Tax=Dietzia cinnamea TaxID=321318 RepID=A0AAW5QBG4_9ACTN|nr:MULTISPECIES: hypothetical protein [Dietzia]MCT1865553.1 hypothetical protein [Dietzia cinnamea]MCT2031590.1 hypothetical protein [Dietzia cinnamea]MCT2035067.1 hypothetical protein [Dietzia cinnamea]MCT2077684.1 hypothetical protein [Dietzia cinnamea]MCT2107768.1 hypothetical protein [Dietzia cinnamea]